MATLQQLQDGLKNPYICAALCLVLGISSAFAMAPYNIFPLLLFGLSGLYYCLNQTSIKKLAFFYGWLFGFGYFVFGLHWIGNALLVEGNPYKWAWPLAVTGLPFLLAFFMAAPAFLAHKFFNLKSGWGFSGFCALFALFEILRGFIFTGFPWNLFGYTWSATLEIAQLASLTSIYGLNALTIFWASSAGFFLVTKDRHTKTLISAVLFLSIAGAYGYGHARLQNSLALGTHENTYIQIVHGNIKQEDKWKAELLEPNFQKHLQLSQPIKHRSQQNTTIIVWPETAISYHILNSPVAMREIKNMLKSHTGKAYLLTGALIYDPQAKTYANTLMMIDQNGSINNIYKKHHLVPFGEYIPFQKWIPLPTVTRFKGFEKGNGPTTLIIGDLKYAPAVCYEIIFPGAQTNTKDKVNMIVNVTNDGWYGDSPGPYQHFVQAQFRAIEEGVPVIRSANTGISGLIDPFGQVLTKSELFSTYSQEILLPKDIRDAPQSFLIKMLVLLGFLMSISTIAYIRK